MAMNKYGRASKLTTTPPAATQQVKIPTQEEINAIISENEGLEATYNKELSNYTNSMNLYKNGPATTNQQGGVKFDSGNLQSGQKATFSGGSGSAEKWNKATEEQIKSGKVVHISQLDKVTQDFLKGAGFGPHSDSYGTVKDVYVPKGTTIKTWKDLYGTDFNPVEFDAAEKAGKLKEYEIAKGIQGKTFMPKIDAYEKYTMADAPVKPAYKEVPKLPPPPPPPPAKKEVIEKLPVKAPQLIKQKPPGELKVPKERNPVEWEAPVGAGKKKADKKIALVSGDRTVKVRSKKINGIGSKTDVHTSSMGFGKNNLGKKILYQREKKAAIANYTGRGELATIWTENKDDFTNMDTRSISETIDQSKSAKKKVRQSDLSGQSKRAVLKELRQDIRQGKRSNWYHGRGDMYTGSVDIDTRTGELANSDTSKKYIAKKEVSKAGLNSKLSVWTPEYTTEKNAKGNIVSSPGAMNNYMEAIDYKNYKSSLDNATNRNMTFGRMVNKGLKNK
jgi:hypothetical protein